MKLWLLEYCEYCIGTLNEGIMEVWYGTPAPHIIWNRNSRSSVYSSSPSLAELLPFSFFSCNSKDILSDAFCASTTFTTIPSVCHCALQGHQTASFASFYLTQVWNVAVLAWDWAQSYHHNQQGLNSVV